MAKKGQPPVVIGELRRQTMLGSVATYRVVDVAGELVEVEVVEAPGIEPGFRARLLLSAVAEMELLDPALAPEAAAPLAQVIDLPARRRSRPA